MPGNFVDFFGAKQVDVVSTASRLSPPILREDTVFSLQHLQCFEAGCSVFDVCIDYRGSYAAEQAPIGPRIGCVPRPELVLIALNEVQPATQRQFLPIPEHGGALLGESSSRDPARAGSVLSECSPPRRLGKLGQEHGRSR